MPESAKEGAGPLAESSDIGLGVPWRYPGRIRAKRRKALQHGRLLVLPQLLKAAQKQL